MMRIFLVFKEGIDYLRVKLAALTTIDYVKSDSRIHCFPVGTLGGDGVISISHRQNSGTERYLFTR